MDLMLGWSWDVTFGELLRIDTTRKHSKGFVEGKRKIYEGAHCLVRMQTDKNTTVQ